jgi:predicted HD superfamily hydrolase involved in NAD metabolism
MHQEIIERYLPFLEKVLTPKRLEHSLGVMEVMGELAEVYSLDPDQALATGLLHDAAKDLSPAEQAEIIAQYHIQIQHEAERDYVLYLHGPVGACFLQRELGIYDQPLLDAITAHTYWGNGSNFHAPLSWCLRFADVLEPTRNWSNVRWLKKGVPRLREAVYAGCIWEGAFLQTGWLIQWFSESNMPLHPNMLRIHQELSDRLGLDETFLE